MNGILPQALDLRHPERLQDGLRLGRAPMAKADLKKVQKQTAWQIEGAACRRAIQLARLSHKEAAARLDLKESGLASQLAGAERPQTELFRADDVLRGPLLIAYAEQHPELFDVVTTITVRRSA